MNEKQSKVLKAATAVIVGAGLIAGGIALGNAKDEAKDLGFKLADVNASLTSSQITTSNLQQTIDSLNDELAETGLVVEKLENKSEEDGDTIAGFEAQVADLKEVVAELNATIEAVEPVVVFKGYDKEFGLGEDLNISLTDNQFEKLADYEVSVDGEDVSVEESLKVSAYFNKEDSLSLMFDEDSVDYSVKYDVAANISEENPMKISLFGEEVEVIGVESGKLTIKTMSDKFVKAGESLNGVEVVKISEDAILVKVGDEMELLSKGSHEVNDVKIEVGSILYIEGDADNLVNLKAGSELEKVYETSGDDKYYDEAEMWKFTKIEAGEIVISLAEDVEEVSELSLPNDYAKISFKVDDVDYNKVKVEKEDGVISKVSFELEDFDSTYVELKDGVWEPEDDEEVIDFVSGVALVDSEYSLVIKNGKVFIVNSADEKLVKVLPSSVVVDGDSSFDNDENIISVDGIVVEPTEDYTTDEDETLVVEVPEEVVKADLIVE